MRLEAQNRRLNQKPIAETSIRVLHDFRLTQGVQNLNFHFWRENA
jgi:hypothetical protein